MGISDLKQADFRCGADGASLDFTRYRGRRVAIIVCEWKHSFQTKPYIRSC